MKDKCAICKEEFDLGELYEYRGIIYCEKCHDKAIEKKDFERAEVAQENNRRTECFRGLDLGDSVIGKANRKILKPQIEIAKKQRSQSNDH